ncbi:TonB-dependent receptor [Methylobacillus gramineus]|uniref:TonB-dependent receptor domain-containing protein n=1 Tax=Methylobacillus gramineus TaxID=755169 RepID=UPI001CFFB129|nr:TonB-dependent receptor [Methylobacillus gramineus]
MLTVASFAIQAAELDTKLPAVPQNNGSLAPINIDLPSQPLDVSLKQLARSTGMSVAFDSKLASDKTAPAIKGRMKADEALKILLAGSGLESTIDRDNAVIKPIVQKPDVDMKLEAIEVRSKRFYEIGPLPGLGLTKEQIPGNVQSLTAKDIKEAHSLSITDLMNSKLQSVNVNDYQGNPFQMDVQYRGFTAGPQIGTPQGLSVFFDGIRVNEPFGDVVNWDMLPMNALASFDVFPGSNPIFGLGTLGGALSMKTKDGFSNPGVDAEILTGSFGRKQLQASGGWNNGTVGIFGAGNFFMEDGWRENSPSKVNQAFGKASYRGDKLDLNLSTLVVWNDLVGNGMLPSEMYKQDRNGVFTSPDTTDNRLWQFQLSGSYFVNDHFTITGQAYRRNSKRKTLGADVYTEWDNAVVKRNLNVGEQFTCLYRSTNNYGLPDYYIVPAEDGRFTASRNDFVRNVRDLGFDAAVALLPTSAFNATLPAEFVAYAQAVFNQNKNLQQSVILTPGAGGSSNLTPPDATDYSNGQPQYLYDPVTNLTSIAKNGMDLSQVIASAGAFYYYEPDGNGGVGTKYVMIISPSAAINGSACQGDVDSGTGLPALQVPSPNGTAQTVDGAAYNGIGTGVAEGTPTAVLTDTQIDQVTDGASIQLNWNLDKHKFMVGASIDAPSAKYKNGQMLGMLDAERDAYLAPDEIRDQYAAASQEISNNNFKGNQLTKSIYASETWSPVETLHFTGALRYNETHGKNKIASRTYGSFAWNLAQLEAFPDYYNVCVNGVCPTTGYITPDVSNLLNKPETEKFRYYSLNPSFGTTWQATPNLNIYGNWAQGTRVPSVVELGCAFDRTPVNVGTLSNPIYAPRSLAENRSCSLPTTLSGDPYLPQIKATTWDFGMRGKLSDNVDWNLGIYRTDLKDDIYMIGFPGNRSFFDTIGSTRRQGVEAGITAAFEKWRLRLNYALTEATFQDNFWMPANDNSSSVEEFYGNKDYSRRIQVNPGNRMPGVPLHNINATVSYQVSEKWQIGLTAVAHSFAYVRGNENNEHQKGVTLYDTIEDALTGTDIQVARRPTNNPGTTPGYMIFNLQTSYKLNSEWTLGLRINNIFDHEYFTAGRLGRNPFSPSVYGAIGQSGYNHNSTDWLSTNFLAPGAPRAAWISLSYEFDPRK